MVWPWLPRLGEFFMALLLFYSASMHYKYAGYVATVLQPPWIPWRLFWAYFTGLGMLAAGVSFVLHRQTRLAAILLTVLFFLYVALIHAPSLIRGILDQPQDATNLWASNGTGGINNALKDFALMLSAVFVAATHRREPTSVPWPVKLATGLFGAVMILYGIEHYIYTDFTPGLPSVSKVSFWIPGRLFWGYFTGGGMLLAGALILAGKRAAEAALALGILLLTAALLSYIFRLAAHDYSNGEFINFLKDLGVAGGAMVLFSVLSQDVGRAN